MFRSKLFTIHFTILFKILNHFTILKNCYENFSEAVVGGVLLKISQTSREYTCVRVSFFKKDAGLSLQLY